MSNKRILGASLRGFPWAQKNFKVVPTTLPFRSFSHSASFTPSLSQSSFARASRFAAGALSAAALFALTAAIVYADGKDPSTSDSTEDEYKNFIVPDRTGESHPSDLHGPVIRVTGSQAENLLLNPSKTVLLKVYSPTCESCKNLDFVWRVIAEEFEKDCDSIVFANLDGYENYVRGLIDYANEGRFPHIIAFPAGEEKVEQFKTARDMATRFAQYHNHRLPKALKDVLVFDADGSDTPSDVPVDFQREDIPPVGIVWPMKWRQGQSMLDAMIEFIADTVTSAKYPEGMSSPVLNVDGIKKRVFGRIPEIQKNILEAANDAYLSPWDKAAQADPCGVHIKRAMEQFYCASAGLPTAALGALAMADYRQCLYDNEKAVRKFYKEIEEHVDFLSDIMKNKNVWKEQDISLKAQVVEKYPLVAKEHGLTKESVEAEMQEMMKNKQQA